MVGRSHALLLSQDIHEHAARIGSLLDAWEIDRAAARPVPSRLPQAVGTLRFVMGSAGDLHIRQLRLPSGIQVAVALIDGLAEDELIDRFVLTPLSQAPGDRSTPQALEDWLVNQGLQATDLRRVGTFLDLIVELHHGGVAVLVDGLPRALVLNFSGFEHRPPEEPQFEVTTSGPREGFTEVLRTNVAAVRRRLADPCLRVEDFRVGRLSRSHGTLLYVLGRVDPLVLERVRRRLARINLDTVVDTSQVAAFLVNRPWTPFMQLRATERPEVCVAALSEGRVVVMLDGTPFALIAPSTFWDLIQSPEDYFLRWPFAWAMRFLRLAAMALSLCGLALYVAVVNYHHELVPTNLLVTIVTSRAAVPYPTLLEALILSVGFDLLREAGTRMPRGIGGALSVVGALVIGDAMVRVGLASALAVVLVAMTAVATLALPTFASTIPFRFLSYVLLLLGSSFGLFGVAVGVTIIAAHLASLECLGKPFLASLTPIRVGALLEDVLLRLPWAVRRRPVPFIPVQSAQRGASNSRRGAGDAG